ncbi:uncharacterized protein LOC126727959 [Quercus robur]|uniref:uncharacterized protein LOC126727959 n=1 Tax=Quercus robur TaxID=38942 RepID=UPI002161DC44|nr:uncharacterized protein LOC126727959 [Quercus robur]
MVKDKCNMKDDLFVPSIGKSGGLALFWKEGVIVMVQTYSQTHIDALVDGGANVGWWHFTGFYGNPDTAKRPESWAKLKYLKGTSSLPWLTIGDFNEIIGTSEKEGGSDRPRQQMTNFVETINACRLRDLGYTGPKFTWNYGRADSVQIRERLDRALATPEWISLFPLAKLYHLSSSVLDHAPLVLRMTQQPSCIRQKKLFWFESMWLKDQRYDSLIFCKASLEECDALQKVLRVYEEEIKGRFSSNTPTTIKEEIKGRFGAQVIKQHEKYLGLPSLVGRNKRNSFNDIKEKVGKKVAGWKEKMLSKAGKEVLIKAVAQAIPTYTMSCFKIPDSLCDDLTGMIRNF